MKEQIKKLRKTLDLTQQEFADRLGIKRGNVATYETRDGNPGSSVIALICREFNVNENWLRTGEGEMFHQTEDTAVAKLCTEMGASELEQRILRAYFQINSKIRDAFMNSLIEKVKAEFPAEHAPETEPASHPQGRTPHEEMTLEELHAELDRQYNLEKGEATSAVSSSASSDGSEKTG